MTLFYISPDDDFPNPPKGLAPEDIAHKKILDNWFALTDSLEPEFSKLTFFPENILPHERSTYLQAFAKEYENRLKSGELSESILNSLAINVANVYRFSPLVKEGIHYPYIQKVIDEPLSGLKLEKNPLIDTYLTQSLAEGIFKFCEEENFPKKVMCESNWMLFIGTKKNYQDYLKSIFSEESIKKTVAVKPENYSSIPKAIKKRKGLGPNHPAWTVISILITLGGLYYIYAQALRNAS